MPRRTASSTAFSTSPACMSSNLHITNMGILKDITGKIGALLQCPLSNTEYPSGQAQL